MHERLGNSSRAVAAMKNLAASKRSCERSIHPKISDGTLRADKLFFCFQNSVEEESKGSTPTAQFRILNRRGCPDLFVGEENVCLSLGADVASGIVAPGTADAEFRVSRLEGLALMSSSQSKSSSD